MKTPLLAALSLASLLLGGPTPPADTALPTGGPTPPIDAALPTGASTDSIDPLQQVTTSTVVLGSYQCDADGLEAVDGYVERVHGPLADELVAEGMWLEWAYLTHRYGDDFNRVLLYRAADLESHLAASAEFTRRLAERSTGSSPMAEHCPRHKDNIYTRTLPASSEEGS